MCTPSHQQTRNEHPTLEMPRNYIPRLAVIMSIYKNDRLSYVKESVESILNQTYSKFDFYIIYDGHIADDIDAYITSIKDNRIQITRRTENLGLAQSLNDLLKIVLPRGYEYIARMDADDISIQDRFAKQVAFLSTNPAIDCVGTCAIEITSNGDEYFRKQMPETNEQCLKLFKKRDCLIHPTVMFRRVYFDKAGLYPIDTYFGEDTIMWAQGFKAGLKFANIQDYVFKFRIDDDFFNRRRGWKHAISILSLRRRVNKMLNFGFIAYVYAFLYALVKMMPTQILNIIYKISR
jgi:glycosyltransferase involved in cell wall biosynthesis